MNIQGAWDVLRCVEMLCQPPVSYWKSSGRVGDIVGSGMMFDDMPVAKGMCWLPDLILVAKYVGHRCLLDQWSLLTKRADYKLLLNFDNRPVWNGAVPERWVSPVTKIATPCFCRSTTINTHWSTLQQTPHPLYVVVRNHNILHTVCDYGHFSLVMTRTSQISMDPVHPAHAFLPSFIYAKEDWSQA